MPDSTLHDKAIRAADIASLIEPCPDSLRSVSWYPGESGVRYSARTFGDRAHEFDEWVGHLVDLWGAPEVRRNHAEFQLVWCPEEDVVVVLGGDVTRWLGVADDPEFRLVTREAVAS